MQTAATTRPLVLRVLRAAVAATLLVGVLFVGALLGVSSVTAPSLLPAPAPAAASTILP